MSAVRPAIFTELHEEDFQEERPVSEETVRKLIHNTNMLRALLPIALVKAFNINMPGVKIPSTRLYQYCDGGDVTEPGSPLNGAGSQSVPDMQGEYIRGGFASDTASTEAGGSPSVNLNHTHGATDVTDSALLLEAGDEQRAFEPVHAHGMPDSLGDTPLALAHFKVAYYLKINQ